MVKVSRRYILIYDYYPQLRNTFRYLLVEILFTESGEKIREIAESDVYHAIYNQVAHLFGDYGAGAIKSSFQVCYSLKNAIQFS